MVRRRDEVKGRRGTIDQSGQWEYKKEEKDGCKVRAKGRNRWSDKKKEVKRETYDP